MSMTSDQRILPASSGTALAGGSEVLCCVAIHCVVAGTGEKPVRAAFGGGEIPTGDQDGPGITKKHIMTAIGDEVIISSLQESNARLKAVAGIAVQSVISSASEEPIIVDLQFLG
jgi:hypothetical protein